MQGPGGRNGTAVPPRWCHFTGFLSAPIVRRCALPSSCVPASIRAVSTVTVGGRECTQRCRSDGHQSGGPPDAAGGVLHRRIAATAGARAGDLTEGPCVRSPPLGRVQARHGGPEPAPVRLRAAGLTVVAAMRGLPRRCHVSSQRQPLGSCEATIVGGQSRPSAPWPSCPGTRAVRCRSCTTGDRGSAQPANKRVSGCHVSTKRPPPVAFQRRTGRADG